MTVAVQKLLDSFEALPNQEKHLAAVEILRRISGPAENDLSEQALVEISDELFRTLDAEEGDDAKP
jgi:hypothetical protein